MGLSNSWLIDTLNKNGIEHIEQILIAQIDDSGKLYIDLYDSNQKN